MKVNHLSGSRLDTYEKCQWWYSAIYDEKMPEGEVHPLTKMGSTLHRMFELATNARITPGVPEMLQDPFHHEAGAVSEFEMQPDLIPLLRELVNNALRWGYFRDTSKCVGTEVELDFDLADGTNVLGYIDRLDVDGSTAEVRDLKTKKRLFTPQQLERNWQARIYNIGARRLYPEVTGKVRVAFWMLRHQVQSVVLSADDAARDEEELMAVAREIRECEKPEGSPSALCPWCPRHGNCDFEKMGIKARFRKRRG